METLTFHSTFERNTFWPCQHISLTSTLDYKLFFFVFFLYIHVYIFISKTGVQVSGRRKDMFRS